MDGLPWSWALGYLGISHSRLDVATIVQENKSRDYRCLAVECKYQSMYSTAAGSVEPGCSFFQIASVAT